MRSVKQAPFDIHTLAVGSMQVNCYLIVERQSRSAIIVDPGDDGQYIIDAVIRIGAKPTILLATHGHFDHIMAAFELQMTFDIPFALHADDRFLVDRMAETASHFLGISVTDPPPKVTRWLKAGDTISFGCLSLNVLPSPGHTPGSVLFELDGEQCLWVGDTIFQGGSMGRTDFSYSDSGELVRSIGRILAYPPDTILYPGHGKVTTVREERVYHHPQT